MTGWDKERYDDLVAEQGMRIAALEVALRQLANEASGFKSMADPFVHGNTNMAVLGLRIDEARAVLDEPK